MRAKNSLECLLQSQKEIKETPINNYINQKKAVKVQYTNYYIKTLRNVLVAEESQEYHEKYRNKMQELAFFYGRKKFTEQQQSKNQLFLSSPSSNNDGRYANLLPFKDTSMINNKWIEDDKITKRSLSAFIPNRKTNMNFKKGSTLYSTSQPSELMHDLYQNQCQLKQYLNEQVQEQNMILSQQLNVQNNGHKILKNTKQLNQDNYQSKTLDNMQLNNYNNIQPLQANQISRYDNKNENIQQQNFEIIKNTLLINNQRFKQIQQNNYQNNSKNSVNVLVMYDIQQINNNNPLLIDFLCKFTTNTIKLLYLHNINLCDQFNEKIVQNKALQLNSTLSHIIIRQCNLRSLIQLKNILLKLNNNPSSKFELLDISLNNFQQHTEDDMGVDHFASQFNHIQQLIFGNTRNQAQKQKNYLSSSFSSLDTVQLFKLFFLQQTAYSEYSVIHQNVYAKGLNNDLATISIRDESDVVKITAKIFGEQVSVDFNGYIDNYQLQYNKPSNDNFDSIKKMFDQQVHVQEVELLIGFQIQITNEYTIQNFKEFLSNRKSLYFSSKIQQQQLIQYVFSKQFQSTQQYDNLNNQFQQQFELKNYKAIVFSFKETKHKCVFLFTQSSFTDIDKLQEIVQKEIIYKICKFQQNIEFEQNDIQNDEQQSIQETDDIDSYIIKDQKSMKQSVSKKQNNNIWNDISSQKLTKTSDMAIISQNNYLQQIDQNLQYNQRNKTFLETSNQFLSINEENCEPVYNQEHLNKKLKLDDLIQVSDKQKRINLNKPKIQQNNRFNQNIYADIKQKQLNKQQQPDLMLNIKNDKQYQQQCNSHQIQQQNKYCLSPLLNQTNASQLQQNIQQDKNKVILFEQEQLTQKQILLNKQLNTIKNAQQNIQFNQQNEINDLQQQIILDEINQIDSIIKNTKSQPAVHQRQIKESIRLDEINASNSLNISLKLKQQLLDKQQEELSGQNQILNNDNHNEQLIENIQQPNDQNNIKNLVQFQDNVQSQQEIDNNVKQQLQDFEQNQWYYQQQKLSTSAKDYKKRSTAFQKETLQYNDSKPIQTNKTVMNLKAITKKQQQPLQICKSNNNEDKLTISQIEPQQKDDKLTIEQYDKFLKQQNLYQQSFLDIKINYDKKLYERNHQYKNHPKQDSQFFDMSTSVQQSLQKPTKDEVSPIESLSSSQKQDDNNDNIIASQDKTSSRLDSIEPPSTAVYIENNNITQYNNETVQQSQKEEQEDIFINKEVIEDKNQTVEIKNQCLSSDNGRLPKDSITQIDIDCLSIIQEIDNQLGELGSLEKDQQSLQEQKPIININWDQYQIEQLQQQTLEIEITQSQLQQHFEQEKKQYIYPLQDFTTQFLTESEQLLKIRQTQSSLFVYNKVQLIFSESQEIEQKQMLYEQQQQQVQQNDNIVDDMYSRSSFSDTSQKRKRKQKNNKQKQYVQIVPIVQLDDTDFQNTLDQQQNVEVKIIEQPLTIISQNQINKFEDTQIDSNECQQLTLEQMIMQEMNQIQLDNSKDTTQQIKSKEKNRKSKKARNKMNYDDDD